MTLAGPVKAAKEVTSPTAELCAVVRAAETMRPKNERLFTDDFARYFLRSWHFRSTRSIPPMLKFGLWLASKRFSGLIAEVALRHRHCDEIVAAEVADGCRQVVVLGAGYDTTALRGGLGPDAVVYEVDKPNTQADKLGVIERNGLCPAQPVKYVSCDFDSGDDLIDTMLAYGFDPKARSVIIWMGVTYYLPENAVMATLNKLSSITSPDSKVIVDYIDSSAMDGSGAHASGDRATQVVAKSGEPFRFGLARDEVNSTFAVGGLGVATHYRVPELVRRYSNPATFWLAVADFMGVVTLQHDSR